MKRLIRWALNRLPRTLLQRLAGWMVPVAGLLYAGRGRECPVCGARRRKFMPYGYVTQREDALCPSCLSLERHRALWLLLFGSEGEMAGRAADRGKATDRGKGVVTTRQGLKFSGRLLHIAPEVCFRKRLRRIMQRAGGEYVTADLESPLADLHFDVQQIPLADGSACTIICNHLLEHVADDRRALSELYRIMAVGGWGVLTVPVDLTRAATFEDDSVTDPVERTRIFGQYDHRRIYGLDYGERLREAGFEVEVVDVAAAMSDEECRRYAIRRREPIYIVRKS